MTDTIKTEYGQALSLSLTFYQDEAKTTPVDLTGATVSVNDASHSPLLSATAAVLVATDGTVQVEVSEAIARQLPTCHISWFRVEVQYAGTNIVTPPIRIDINGE